jgi:type II secretory pathway pseudopilin PulG
MRRNRLKGQEGYSLLEIVISLGVLISVLFIGMGAVISMFGAYKRSQDLKSVIGSLNLALDTMSREIVVGTRFHCGVGSPNTYFPEQSCANNGGDWITFCSSESQRIFYRYQGTPDLFLERAIIENSNCVLDDDEPWQTEDNPPSGWLRVTAPEVRVSNMKFYISGASSDPIPDFLQSRVLIYLEGEAGPSYAQTDFAIQTTVSQRAPDLSILSLP